MYSVVFSVEGPHLACVGKWLEQLLKEHAFNIQPLQYFVPIMLSFFVCPECPEGRYGYGCAFSCDCAQGATCEPYDGECMCPIGFGGPRCTESKFKQTISSRGIVLYHADFMQPKQYVSSQTLKCLQVYNIISEVCFHCPFFLWFIHTQTSIHDICLHINPWYLSSHYMDPFWIAKKKDSSLVTKRYLRHWKEWQLFTLLLSTYLTDK